MFNDKLTCPNHKWVNGVGWVPRGELHEVTTPAVTFPTVPLIDLIDKVKCFLVEPIFGEDDPTPGYDSWDSRTITGWRRADTGEIRKHLSEFPVGAMWRAYWLKKNWIWSNETEPHVIVRCPNGAGTRDWDIDSRASNCALPSDTTHRCWVRHGRPPNLTVDKNGPTCSAGAGSIALPNWHGFLRGGMLTI